MSNFAGNSFIPMKYSFLVLAFLGILSCGLDSGSDSDDPYLVSDEVFKMKLGNNEVYGVRLKVTAPEKRSFIAYSVRLAQNEKVWLDTIYTEVSMGDTIENELIFSEAVVNPDDQVEVRTQSIKVE